MASAATLVKCDCACPVVATLGRLVDIVDDPLGEQRSASGTPNPEGLLCQVDAIKNLPVLSKHQAQLRELVANDGTSLQQVADMVECNPPFAANLVRIANSPIYAQRIPVDTIKRAIQVIGFRGVGDMAVTLEVVQGFGFPPHLDMQLFWDHAVNVALLAKDLGRSNGLDGDKAYLIGLLHDVGFLVLPKYLPAAFAQLMKLSADGAPIHEACRDYFGCTPLDVTARLMRRWSFGPELWEPVAFL